MSPVRETRALEGGRARVSLGDLMVTQTRSGYLARHQRTRKTLAFNPLDPPAERTFSTTGIWLHAPPGPLGTSILSRDESALHAIEHTTLSVLTILSMSEPADLRGFVTDESDSKRHGIFLFDAHEGGIGIAELGYKSAETLLAMAHTIMNSCKCVSGCPLCVQTYRCESSADPERTRGAALLEYILTGHVGAARVARRKPPAARNGHHVQRRLNGI